LLPALGAAVAVAGATAPYTVETACVEPDLAALQARPANKKDIDRTNDLAKRLGDVKKIEQDLEAGLTADSGSALSGLALPAGLALVGLIGVVIGAGRRSRMIAALSGLAIVGAAALAIVPAQRRHDDGKKLAAAHACRLRLNEVRGAVLEAQFGRCLFDLGEGAEDLQRYENEVKAGQPINPDRLKHTRLEMSELF
jgi:hypothetical protein